MVPPAASRASANRGSDSMVTAFFMPPSELVRADAPARDQGEGGVTEGGDAETTVFQATRRQAHAIACSPAACVALRQGRQGRLVSRVGPLSTWSRYENWPKAGTSVPLPLASTVPTTTARKNRPAPYCGYLNSRA